MSKRITARTLAILAEIRASSDTFQVIAAMIHTYSTTPYIVSDRYHAWAEHQDGSKVEIGEYREPWGARVYASRYLLELPICTPLPKIVIERVVTFKEYMP